MPKRIINFPDELDEILQKDSEKQDRPVAAIVRKAVADYYRRRGIEVESRMKWGGSRRKQSQQEPA